MPEPVDCPLWLVDKHFIEPIPGQEGVGENTKHVLVLYVMSAKRHCQMVVLGTVTNPKSTPLTGVQYVSMLCVLILFRLYHTEKDYTSKIIKIARIRVKCIQNMPHMSKEVRNHTALFSHLLLHPNPSGIIYVLTV